MKWNRLLVLFLVAVNQTGALAQRAPKVHELNAGPQTVHRSFFDASLKPVLTIESGDIVKLKTATGNPRYFERLGVPRDKIPPELFKIFEGVDGDGRGDHTLNGPIHVNGAQPGDMLEVRIRSVDLWLPIAGQGFAPGRGLLPEEFPVAKDRVLWLDLKNRTTEYAPNVVVPLKPFWGVMGVAPPPAMGRVSSGPPDVFGGNLDNRDLVGGTTLYLPVFNPGALLSIGDGHAAQGYGEICLSAIETSLQGEIQVVLHKNKLLKQPRAETPTHYMTMGLHKDLDEAAKIAAREMLDWIVELKKLSRDDAYMLGSSVMDLVVTQVVDGTKGIHAYMPKQIYKRTPLTSPINSSPVVRTTAIWKPARTSSSGVGIRSMTRSN
jgi:acetamidase/formamidase